MQTFSWKKHFVQKDEISQMLDKASKRNIIGVEMEQCYDLVTKIHDKVIQKARKRRI